MTMLIVMAKNINFPALVGVIVLLVFSVQI